MLQKLPKQAAPQWAAKHAFLKYREGRGWYYVRAVPRKLWAVGRVTPIQRALGAERSEVEKAYAREHADVEALFERWGTDEVKPSRPAANIAPLTKVTPSTIRRIVAEHREATLQIDLDWRAAELEKARADPDAFYAAAGEAYRADDYYLMLAGDPDLSLDTLVGYHVHATRKAKLNALKREQQCGDFASGALASDAAFDGDDQRLLMQARVNAEIGVLKKIADGDEHLFAAVKAEADEVRKEAKTARPVAWNECIDAWEAFHKLKGGPGDQRHQIRAFLERFARWVKKPPNEVTREDVDAWCAMRLSEDEVTLKTVRSRDLPLLRSMYKRAIGKRILPRGFDNPATEIDLPELSRTAPKSVATRGFNDREATAILAAAEKESDPLYRWVPLLMNYSGARVGEPVHLRPEDVRRDDDSGVWCWWPTQHKGERTQKTGFSNRPIPLHPAIEKDFCAFVAQKKKERAKYLFFTDWNPRDKTNERRGVAKEKPGKKAIERLREWAHKVAKENGFQLGEKYGLEPNHAWRSRFETLCERAGISDDVQRWFTGHEARDAHGGYKKPDVRAMAAALAKFASV